MKNLRIYGESPYSVAVIHGGPGAPGQMAPVARELSRDRGVLEPLQTAATLDGQVGELHDIIKKHGNPPVILIGSSWGAMLSYIFTARYPALVKKLIMVGSAVFDDRYAAGIQGTRLSRLDAEAKREVYSLVKELNEDAVEDKNKMLARLGELFTKGDAYDPITLDTEVIEVSFDIHDRVWGDAINLRKSGELLKMGKKIKCPVVALHGDYDPHPAEGVREPLSKVLKDFRFITLERCGHLPWIEREAMGRFYELVRGEIIKRDIL
ncbi:MAG: alpha/beta hydrolase [Dehalococcoidia bacterium]|jgi:pimeloyl-ACP methyl ester carboxylesterase